MPTFMKALHGPFDLNETSMKLVKLKLLELERPSTYAHTPLLVESFPKILPCQTCGATVLEF
jgi:hypothetical protein